MRKTWSLLLVLAAVALALAACSQAEAEPTASPTSTAQPTSEFSPLPTETDTPKPGQPTATPSVVPPAGPTPTAVAPTPTSTEPAETPPAQGEPTLPATRLGSHLFVPVGESRSIGGLGALIEAIHMSIPSSVAVEGTTLTAIAGGLSCLRFAYREVVNDNSVQTLCVVAFDETGDCSDFQPLTLDLQQHLGAASDPVGNAGLLESGAGRFYAACLTPTGAYRLQQSSLRLPPLYFTVVDALGDGPYSLGDSEMDAQRAGVVTTFSGIELRPPWIITVSREISELRITDSLRFEFNDEDCDQVSSCTYAAGLAQPGDILRISVGAGLETFGDIFTEMTLEDRDRFFQERIGVGWDEMAAIHPDGASAAFIRLAAVEIMEQLVAHFDGLYNLREKGVAIAYWQPWPAANPIPYPFSCFPDEIAPGESERCQRIEDAVQDYEAGLIGALRDDGHNLWHAGSISYSDGGAPKPYGDQRPHYSLFAGIMANVGAVSSGSAPDIPAALATAVSAFAGEIGPQVPVVLSLSGPPITAQTGGSFCEADICASDFKGMYEQSEAALHAAVQALSDDHFVGFGIALFEGAHFDIREPYERYQSFALNRVGETGYNNPLLNIYRAR